MEKLDTGNSPPLTTAAVQTDIEQFLEGYFADQLTRAQALSPSYEQLWQTIRDVVLAGGKRLRPYLLLQAYRAYGGQDYENCLEIAAAWELLHQSMLVHDDIIDHDTMRHGRPNVTGTYRALSAAEFPGMPEAAALLAGDLLLSGAYHLLARSRLPAAAREQVTASLEEAVFSVVGGELLDVQAVQLPPHQAQTTAIMELKTARYSFVLPLVTGARLAGAAPAEISKLQNLGRRLGLAYQLADDIIGVFGYAETSGKSTMGDLREGKRTALLQATLTRLSASDGQQLMELVGAADLDATGAEAVRHYMEQSGALLSVHREIDSYLAAARSAVHTLDMHQAYKDSFITFMDSLPRRQF